jgi:hypothetical protein
MAVAARPNSASAADLTTVSARLLEGFRARAFATARRSIASIGASSRVPTENRPQYRKV